MEPVKTENCTFTEYGMVPEAGDELTVPWGRRLVANLVSGYGIVGTLTMPTPGKVGINFGLTTKFRFPPHIYCFVQTKTEGLQEVPRSGFIAQNAKTITYRYIGQNYGDKKVAWMSQPPVSYVISGDHVIFQTLYEAEAVDKLKTRFDNPFTVYFRIHGV